MLRLCCFLLCSEKSPLLVELIMLWVEIVVGSGGFAAASVDDEVAVAFVVVAVLGMLCWDPEGVRDVRDSNGCCACVARLPEEVNLRFLTGLRLWLELPSVEFLLSLPWWHLTILAVSLNMQESDLEMKEDRSFSSWEGRFRMALVDDEFMVNDGVFMRIDQD